MNIQDRIKKQRNVVENELSSHLATTSKEELLQAKNAIFRNETDEKLRLEAVLVMYQLWLAELLCAMEKDQDQCDAYLDTKEAVLSLPVANLREQIPVVYTACMNFTCCTGPFANNRGQYGKYRARIGNWSLGDISGTVCSYLRQLGYGG